MTRDEIMAMEAGREMDALVAEKVMGWELRTFKSNGVDFWHIPGTVRCELDAPKFSTDIGAAWEVVEKMIGEMWNLSLEYQSAVYWCEFGKTCVPGDGEIADTAPLAICRAALLAVMEAT